MPFKIKRVFEPPKRSDGTRVLVDGIWPRGMHKEQAKIDLWLKEAAPSPDLRLWFAHDHERWEEFKERYFKELDAHPVLLEPIRARARRSPVTLLYADRHEEYNNAVALLEYLERPD